MTPELLKSEADNCDKLQYRIEKWKAEKANKQREMLILKTEVETLERTIGEIEDILNQTNNKL
jgi:predicted  nucleic acid-binding Zn-ribbon protein